MAQSLQQRRAEAARVIEANKAKAHGENHARAHAAHGKPGQEQQAQKPEASSGPKPSGTK